MPKELLATATLGLTLTCVVLHHVLVISVRGLGQPVHGGHHARLVTPGRK